MRRDVAILLLTQVLAAFADPVLRSLQRRSSIILWPSIDLAGIGWVRATAWSQPTWMRIGSSLEAPTLQWTSEFPLIAVDLYFVCLPTFHWLCFYMKFIQGGGWLIWHPPKVSGAESSILNWGRLHPVPSGQGLHRLHPHSELLWRFHTAGETALIIWTWNQIEPRPVVRTGLTGMPLLSESGRWCLALLSTSSVLAHSDPRESKLKQF